MMTYQAERENFLMLMQSEGMAPEIARRILRHANTIQRLSAAECNGDYPCDNGERKVEFCSRCEAGYVRSSMTRGRRKPHPTEPGAYLTEMICPNCRAQDLIAQWCAKVPNVCPVCFRPFGDLSGNSTGCAVHGIREPRGFAPIFNGDPRGACVKLKVPSGRYDDVAREGICVPSRNY